MRLFPCKGQLFIVTVSDLKFVFYKQNQVNTFCEGVFCALLHTEVENKNKFEYISCL